MYGLYYHSIANSYDKAFELSRVTAQANIVDMAAQVTVQQHYTVPAEGFSENCEISYAFPLQDKSAVCAFTLYVDGNELRGIVKEKAEARREYEAAIHNNRTAALMEEEKADIFNISLGKIPANAKEIYTAITYLVELRMDLSQIKFYLPTHVAQRYTPTGQTSNTASTPSSVPVTLRLEWNMPCTINSLTSPTHTAELTMVSQEDTHIAATVQTHTYGDIVILCQPSKPHEARACYEETEEGDRLLMLTLVPKLELIEEKCEFVFVIDRSGSMSGSQIGYARTALNLFLRSLPEDCYLNVIGFGSSYDVLFPTKSKKYSNESLGCASTYATSLDADLGGTEILAPLKHLYTNMPAIDGYKRQVFVITDGEVSNTEQVISLVAEQSAGSNGARMFTLGVGEGVSHHLVQGMARAGLGTSEFITDAKRIPATVVKQLKASHTSAVRNVSIDWTGRNPPTPTKEVSRRRNSAELMKKTTRSLLGYVTPSKAHPTSSHISPEANGVERQTPAVCSPIFDGDRFIAYYFLDKDENTPKRIALHATVTGEDGGDVPLTTELPIEAENSYNGTSVMHTLAARSMIQDLEDGARDSYTYGVREAEIVKLALKYNLASKHTSFLVVDYSNQQKNDHSVKGVEKSELIQLRTQQQAYGNAQVDGLVESMSLRCDMYDPTIEDSYCAPNDCLQDSDVRFKRASMSKKKGGFGMNFSLSMPKIFSRSSSAGKKNSPPSYADAKLKERNAASPPCQKPEPFNACELSEELDECEEECAGDDTDCQASITSSREESESDKCDAAAPKLAKNKPASPTLSDFQKMELLVSMQSFDGSFAWSAELLDLVGAREGTVRDTFQENQRESANISDPVLATILALNFIEGKLKAFADSLDMVASKARRWLTSHCKNMDDLMTSARTITMADAAGL